jgi:hypothetical protein
VVLAPRKAYSEHFDPRLYCFGTKQLAALAAGSTVVARLGFAPPARGVTPTAPFIVAPIEQVEPVVAAAKEIASAPWTLLAPAPPPAKPAPQSQPDEAYPTKLTISGPALLDVGRAFEVAYTVTVGNEGLRPVSFLFEPETVGFDLIGPQGPVQCGNTKHVGTTVRELFTTLPPKGKRSITVLLTSLCPGRSFDHPGLYIVRPRLDTRHASGESIGLRTFDGEIVGAEATVMRLHQGRNPQRLPRPTRE